MTVPSGSPFTNEKKKKITPPAKPEPRTARSADQLDVTNGLSNQVSTYKEMHLNVAQL